MGLMKDFKADQLRIMGGCEINNKLYIEETVGSLRDYAFVVREKPSFDKVELAGLHGIKI